jgi:hypothetical protein
MGENINNTNSTDQTLRGIKAIYINIDNIKCMNMTQIQNELHGPNM